MLCGVWYIMFIVYAFVKVLINNFTGIEIGPENLKMGKLNCSDLA